MNSFIAWVGGKKALRKLIYTMFPVQFDRYIEVFGRRWMGIVWKTAESEAEAGGL